MSRVLVKTTGVAVPTATGVVAMAAVVEAAARVVAGSEAISQPGDLN